MSHMCKGCHLIMLPAGYSEMSCNGHSLDLLLGEVFPPLCPTGESMALVK